MTNLKITLLLTLASFGAASAQSPAASSNPIKIVSSTQLVTQSVVDGKTVEKLTDGSRALPGQTLEFRQNVQNTSKTNYGKGGLVQPIPSGVLYQSNQCNVPGAVATFSTDPVKLDPKTGGLVDSNRIIFAEKPTKTVTVKENGVSVNKTVPATAEDYTAIRWNLPSLNAAASISCQMRVKVR
ncbi:hypothetical protein [Deinococcus sp.]|uniref:hypothetical protein n=1 Tax=Deinococcus sp. TaxID=47478 RepID=UPI0025C6C455|nr:hypothetical protein [Deinococcus sp.]